MRYLSLLFLLLSTPVFALQQGQTFPALQIVQYANPGKPVAIQELISKNEFTYVKIWATWCGSCRSSFPYLNAWQKKFEDQGFQVVGISMDFDDALEGKKSIDLSKDLNGLHKMIKTHLEEIPADFPIVYGSAETITQTTGEPSPPVGALLDKKGTIVFVHKGFHPRDAKKIEAELEAAMNKPSVAAK